MDFDKYVHHIAQKYRLAVAISVIKSKPSNLSVEEYLLQLQTKMKDIEIDPNETVCSDDFNFDDDDMAYEKNLNVDSTTECVTNNIRIDSLNDNDSQGSQTILNDFVFGDPVTFETNQRESSIVDTIRLLKEVSTDIQEKPSAYQNMSQLTFCESQEASTISNKDITYCYSNMASNNAQIDNRFTQNRKNNVTDSQETELYTLHGFTQNYTHVSQTQGDYFVMSEKYIRNKSSNGIQDDISENNKQMLQSQNVWTQNEYCMANNEAGSIYECQPNVNVENEFSCVRSLDSQNVTVQLARDDVTGYENPLGATQKVKYVDSGSFAQTFQFNMNSDKNEFTCNGKSNNISQEEKRRNINALNITDIKFLNDGKDMALLPFNNQNALELTAIDNKTEQAGRNVNEINHTHRAEPSNSQSQFKIDLIQKPIEVTVDIINNEDNMDVDTSSDDNLQERVPFKVLEEMNRVKSCLSRKECKDRRNTDGGYSTDSGYRSDSISRSLKSSSGTSGIWLNQSAHCLFNHIIQSTGSDDIVKQVAQVLGQLIDLLHEEENYPPFLEEMLEAVDYMVKEMYEGSNPHDNLITKEENIQRLILLNKSKHILQYTIEKITKILEDVHTNLTQENLYELSNITEVENTCYIFHILEIFLKKYMKVKDISSQSSQNSQEDFPKRSSLTELWRKKWNLNCKEVTKIENKSCVLKVCSKVLNKIIVECMNGYSLVSFAALQCFNLIQV